MSRPELHWTAYLWPGLPHVWNRGSWAGLGLALGFTGLTNGLLISTLVWREWISPQLRVCGLLAAALIWVLAYAEARADWRRLRDQWLRAGGTLSQAQQQEAWFCEAQRHYLRGDWEGAHRLLQRLLKADRRDAAARLLEATLLRHEGEWEAALRQLDRLERLETALEWQWEIEAERFAIERGAAIGPGLEQGVENRENGSFAGGEAVASGLREAENRGAPGKVVSVPMVPAAVVHSSVSARRAA